MIIHSAFQFVYCSKMTTLVKLLLIAYFNTNLFILIYFNVSLICKTDYMRNGICLISSTTGQDIIRLPRLFRFLQKPLAQFISVFRAPKSKEGYASIGGGSPLRRITDAQVTFANIMKSVYLNVFQSLILKNVFSCNLL